MKVALRVLFIAGLVLTLGFALIGCGDSPADTNQSGAAGETEAPIAEAPQADVSDVEPADLWEGDMPKVKIEIAGFGDVVVELNREAAPITVDNFLKLVNDGFYDGLGFHRIISGFMIQGGDPQGTGMGGADEQIKGEFASNGVPNPIRHERGVISMARSQAPDSASSQFFIVHQDAFFLDGEYAGFGRVVEGMDVVDRIAEETPVVDGNGSVDQANHPVMTSVTVVD